MTFGVRSLARAAGASDQCLDVGAAGAGSGYIGRFWLIFYST
jgi:hypothetical protein